MDNTLFKSSLRFYQSANADAESIKDGFVIRKQEYGIIMEDIRRNGMLDSVQHYLLLGRRGSGKSTLLKRIQVEIETDNELSSKYIAINLAEEQANIYRLFDLLEEIAAELHHAGVEVEEPLWNVDAQIFARNLFASIHNAIEQSGKKLVLLLDNIDRIFENLHDDASLLREYLLNYDDIKIIGGSTRMTEHFWKYNKPFYEFFRVLELKPLGSAEMKELFLYWSDKLQLPILKEFVDKKAGQLETIRILTDGLPRTLQFFINILINKAEASGYEYLKQIMDYITPLYQERLNALPPAQRKIVLQMAFIWETTGTKELAEATRMDNKVISAQLKQLADKGIAEKIETSNKNHLYRLSERFFNLWLIFTQGSPQEKRRARYLTIFLENFYNGEELKKLAEEHLRNLEEGMINADKAVMLTKAYAQSKCISYKLRDKLIIATTQLKDLDENLRKQLPPHTNSIFEEIKLLLSSKHWPNAIEKAKEIEQNDGAKEFMMGFIYSDWQDYQRAEEFYLLAVDKKNAVAIFNLALLYDNLERFEFAEKYYLLAINYNSISALNNLGGVYYRQNRFELAEKYFLLAVEKKIGIAINNLALLYLKQDKIDLAEKYFLLAIKNGDISALNDLASLYYYEKDKFELAEKYYLLSVESGNNKASHNLALLYYESNSNKADALSIIEKVNEKDNSEKVVALHMVIKVWNGNLEKLYDEIVQFIKQKKIEFIPYVFENLLIHHQKNTINKLFQSPEFGDELKERFLPIYYATQILVAKDTNVELKIPPELVDTVNDILNEIKEKQVFYYGASD